MKFDVKIKELVIEEIITGGAILADVMKKYNIKSKLTVKRWLRKRLVK